jgi:hypothetical protein
MSSTFLGIPWREEIGFGALVLRQHVKPFEAGKDTWSSPMQKQVQHILKSTGESEASLASMEMLEVGLAQGGPLLQLYFFPYEDGVVFLADSVERLGGFSQGGFEFRRWPRKRPERVQAFRLLLDLAAAVNPVAWDDDYSGDISAFSPQGYLEEVMDEVDLFAEPTLMRFQEACEERGISIADLAPDYAMYLTNKQFSDRVAKSAKGAKSAARQAEVASVLDDVAQWYSEHSLHKKLDAKLAEKVFDKLLLPILRKTKACKPEWEILLPRHLPEEHERTTLESLAPGRRGPWLDANPQDPDRQVGYIDLVVDVDYIHKCLAPIYGKNQKARRRHFQLWNLEKRILELADTHPVFAEAVQRFENAKG